MRHGVREGVRWSACAGILSGMSGFPSRVGATCAVMAAIFAAGGVVRADELKLKDGSKVVGTIVGFEANSFKVKTSYGFAVVMKDQVVEITITDSATTTSGPGTATKTAKSEDAKPKSAAAEAKPTSDTTKMSAAAAPAPAASGSQVVMAPANNSNVAPGASVAANAPVGVAVANPAKPKPAVDAPIRESVTGTLYTNDTYGFQMYKPPTWKLIEGARSILPGSITAMGNQDETTYLLIGQDAAGKSLTSDIDATERRLRDILGNFRPIDDKKVTISGLPAVERHFRGAVDDKDWSGVVVYLAKDSRVYTIFGMTLADTDLVQIQENVIARAISSIQFSK
jgi:hypothetical protein